MIQKLVYKRKINSILWRQLTFSIQSTIVCISIVQDAFPKCMTLVRRDLDKVAMRGGVCISFCSIGKHEDIMSGP